MILIDSLGRKLMHILTNDINKCQVEGSGWFFISENINVNKTEEIGEPNWGT